MTDGFAAMDQEWRHIYVNSAWESITGKSRQELLGYTIWQAIPALLGTPFEREYRRAVTEKIPVLFEAYYAPRNRWLTVSGYPSGNGGLAVYAHDITDRRRFEEALLASEERFRRYFELGLIGMAITSPTKGCIEINDELCRILGYERTELLRMTWADLTHPDDLAADVANFHHVMAGELDGYSMDKRFIRKDRRIIHASISVKCVRGPDGSAQYFLSLVQDITARKEAEESLVAARNDLKRSVAERTSQLLAVNEQLRNQVDERERTEERFRLLVDAVRDYAILSLAPDGRVTSWNAGAEHITQYRGDEIIGRHLSVFYTPEDVVRGRPYTALQQAATQGSVEDEGFRVRKDGSRFWAHVVVTALRDPQGKLLGFAKTTRDLTERQRAEESLQATRSELAHVSRVMTMGELAASIAHEINQPLAAIVANANACRRDLGKQSPDLEDIRQALTDIADAGMRAGAVIARIRALVKKSVPEKTPVDVNALVEEVLVLLRGELQNHEVTVRPEFALELRRALGDRVQLQQVVVNLIMNGIEAMSSVVDRARILKIRSENRGPAHVSVLFRDSGVGLAPDRMHRLFDAFYTTKPGGMGMGLPISRSIIEAHGGRLWATPNPVYGATFQFALPSPA